MNKELEDLYLGKWDALVQYGENKGAASPLLMKVNDQYIEADIKIIIFGQETYGWNGDLGCKNVEFLMNDYDAYLHNIKSYPYHYPTRLKKKSSRSFWGRKNFLFFQEQIKFKDVKKIAFLWNNLAKIGNSANAKSKGLGKQSKSIEMLEEKYFQVIEEELGILKPDLIIFRTGNRKIPNSSSNKLTKANPATLVKLEKFPDIVVIKTYHPNAWTFSKVSQYQVLDIIDREFKTLIK